MGIDRCCHVASCLLPEKRLEKKHPIGCTATRILVRLKAKNHVCSITGSLVSAKNIHPPLGKAIPGFGYSYGEGNEWSLRYFEGFILKYFVNIRLKYRPFSYPHWRAIRSIE